MSTVRIYGEINYPPFKADEALANEHIINLKSNIDASKEDLKGNEDKERYFRLLCLDHEQS